MAFSYGPYTFDAQADGDAAAFLWTDQSGTTSALQNANTAGRWCFDTNATTSSNVGPDHGQGGDPDGYAYTEMSSQTSGDIWIVEFDTTLDASANDIEFEYYWCLRGDACRATIQLQSNENGAGWVNRGAASGYGDETIPGTSGVTTWWQKTVDLTGLISHASTRLRLYIVSTADPTTSMWHNDFGLDTISITGTTIDTGGAGMVLASATKTQVTAGAEDPAIFDFEDSREWGAITLAVRQESGTATTALAPTTKFDTIQTTGDITVQDDATIDGLDIYANSVILADVVDLTSVVIFGDLEIQTAGTYDFDAVTVTGDITNTDATGNVVINASNGSSCSTSEPGTGNGEVSILNAVAITITVVDESETEIVGARVYVEAAETVGTITDGDEILNALTNASGVVSDSAFNYESAFNPTGLDILVRVRKSTTSPLYKAIDAGGIITALGYSETIVMVSDE